MIGLSVLPIPIPSHTFVEPLSAEGPTAMPPLVEVAIAILFIICVSAAAVAIMNWFTRK